MNTNNTIPLPDFEPCADCGRPVRWSEADGEYYHARGEDPRARHGGGCWLNSEEPVHPLTEENEKPRSYLRAALPARKRVPHVYKIKLLREYLNGDSGTRKQREVASDVLLQLSIEQGRVTNKINISATYWWLPSRSAVAAAARFDAKQISYRSSRPI